MADRSVLFKYLNPNLGFVLAEGKDASSKTFVNIYLLDLVTGRVVFSAAHKRVGGPYHVVHCENWAVYTYYNEKSRRAELASLELFEGKTQSNSSVFSSLHTTVNQPLVERQSFILGMISSCSSRNTNAVYNVEYQVLLKENKVFREKRKKRGFFLPTARPLFNRWWGKRGGQRRR